MAESVEIHGTCDKRFSSVKDAFAESFTKRGDVGASLAVTVDGRNVIDFWGGSMDQARVRPWEHDTIVCVYSTTKGMTTICAHQLVEQGLLDLDAPVARYWPEFAQAGKEHIPCGRHLPPFSGGGGAHLRSQHTRDQTQGHAGQRQGAVPGPVGTWTNRDGHDCSRSRRDHL